MFHPLFYVESQYGLVSQQLKPPLVMQSPPTRTKGDVLR
jgi:hypothetical protein